MTNNLFDEGGNSWDYDKPSPDTEIGSTLGAYRYNSWNGTENAATYIQSGTYLKLREVTLSLDVPQKYFKLLPGARTMRISASGRNLHTWSNYWGLDPDASQFGNQSVRWTLTIRPIRRPRASSSASTWDTDSYDSNRIARSHAPPHPATEHERAARRGSRSQLLLVACNSDQLMVPNYNNPTPAGLAADPAGAVQQSINGIIPAYRTSVSTWNSGTGILGRESFN